MTGNLVITGGSRGIGAATARLAAARGYGVCVNYRNDAAAAETVVRDIEGAGGRAVAVQADVAREDAVEGLFEVSIAIWARSRRWSTTPGWPAG